MCFTCFEPFGLDEREYGRVSVDGEEELVKFEVENVCLRRLVGRTRRGFRTKGHRAVLLPFVPLCVRNVLTRDGCTSITLDCVGREGWFGRRSRGEELFGGVAMRSERAEALCVRGFGMLNPACNRDLSETALRDAAIMRHMEAMGLYGTWLAGMGREAEGLGWLRKAAERRLVWAMRVLASFLVDRGRAREGLSWYRKAANLGSPPAMVNVADLLLEEGGEEVDEGNAVGWYRKAAECGNSVAMRCWGSCLMTGRFVEMDVAGAVDWYSKAACSGDARAMHYLGRCYREGRGVPVDECAAAVWTEKAALEGWRDGGAVDW
jgi:hypothetical protein